MKYQSKYEAVVIGGSAGGMEAIKTIMHRLPASFPVPLVVVLHRAKDEKELLEQILQSHCSLRVKQADEKEKIVPGMVYVAPPDYHLLVEQDRTFSLSVDQLYNFSRPSIDVLFETAAQAYAESLIGVILTGANSDGAKGMEKIVEAGGLSVVQNPKTALFSAMPLAAVQTGKAACVLDLEQIADFLQDHLKMTMGH